MDRRSRARQALILEVLIELGGFASARRVHRHLIAGRHSISQASVYRALRSTGEDEVERMISPRGETLYRHRTTRSDAVIVCASCGSSLTVQDPDVAAWARDAASDGGFRAGSVRVVYSGICSDCAGLEARNRS